MVRKVSVKAVPVVPAAPPVPAVPQGGWCWGAYAVSLAFPAAGLTMGVLFSGSGDRAARRFGVTCLVLSMAGWTLASFTGWMTDLGFFSGGDGDRYTENYY